MVRMEEGWGLREGGGGVQRDHRVVVRHQLVVVWGLGHRVFEGL